MIHLRLLLAAAFLVAGPGARAQSGEVPKLAYSLTGGTVTPSSTIKFASPADFVRTVTTSSAGDVAFADGIAAKIGTKDVAMQVTRTLPWAGVARLAARAIPYVAQGYLLYTLASALRCAAIANSTGQTNCDQGIAPVSSGGWHYTFAGTDYKNTSASALDTQVAAAQQTYWRANGYPSCVITGTGTTPNGSAINLLFSTSNCGGNGGATLIAGNLTILVCNAGGSLGADGLCPGGQLVQVTEDQLQAKVAAYGNKLTADQLAKDSLDTARVDAAPLVSNPTGTLTGPATSLEPASTTQTVTNGVTSTSTTTPTNNITYNNNTYNYTTSQVTVNGGTTTTTTTPPNPDTQVCGLPGKPACKIDESGTPTVGNFTSADAKLDDAAAGLGTVISGAGTPKSLAWTWGGFSLPAGTCSPIVVPGPSASISDREIDLCGQWWVDWWRAALAWVLSVLTAMYAWHRFSDTVGA